MPHAILSADTEAELKIDRFLAKMLVKSYTGYWVHWVARKFKRGTVAIILLNRASLEARKIARVFRLMTKTAHYILTGPPPPRPRSSMRFRSSQNNYPTYG